MSEQQRIAEELDQRVAERTRELAKANDALKQELAVERQRTEAARHSSDYDSRLAAGSIPGPCAVTNTIGIVCRRRVNSGDLKPTIRAVEASEARLEVNALEMR